MKSVEEVRSNFQAAGLKEFEKRSNFAERFGGKECYGDAFNMVISNIVRDFNRKNDQDIDIIRVQKLVFASCCLR